MPTDSGPGAWLARAAAYRPHQPALISTSGSIDFQELAERTGQIAGRLKASGLITGRPLAVISRNRARLAWALYLALHGGYPLLPLDPRRPALYRLLDVCEVEQSLVDEDLSAPGPARRLPAHWLEAPGASTPEPASPAPTGDVQLIMATSGTTGSPRGVLLSGRSLQAAVRAACSRLGLGPGDRWLLCLPLFHIAGASVLLRCLEAGACVVLHEGFDARRIWADLARHRITHISLVPATLVQLLELSQGAAPPVSLRVVLVGGSPLSGALMARAQQAGWPVCPSYGLSENASQVATLCPTPGPWTPGDVGSPLDGVQVDIVDNAGCPTPGRGRIRIAGATLMAGYAERGLEPGAGLHDGRLVTGDVGYLDGLGHLHVLGRVDEVLVSGGETVHPQEVEELLLRHPRVRDVGVCGVPDETWGERIVAVVATSLDPDTLRGWCQQHIPSPIRPRELLMTTKLPRTATGKLDRRALGERAVRMLYHPKA
jgi:O-succinylbenzoic acid--CoA ligase